MSPRHDSRFCSLRRMLTALGAAAGLVVSNAAAQPQIVSLGRGGPTSAAPGPSGSYILGGSGITSSAAGYWTLNGTSLSISEAAGTGNGAGYLSADGAYAAVLILNSTPPRVFGNTATNVSPPFSMNPTLVPSTTNPQATEFRAARWNLATNTIQDMGGLPIVPELMVYGSGSSGGSSGNFISPNAISATGRFIVGQAYISSYNSSAGTTISDNTFHWRAFIWDAEANGGLGAYTIMPTPFRTSTNTWRRRTGAAFAVSSDGLVVLGAQEHNVSTTPTADPDGARLVVWRWDAGTSQYLMTYLPNGVNGSGFPYTLSVTTRSVHMNAAGTIIVAMAVDNSGNSYLAKWTWDAGTSTWNAPQNLGAGLESEATWLPGSVTSCGLPPIITPTGMSDDGNTIIGSARYSTCGSFMTGGFIWTAAGNSLVDWYDYLVAQGSTDVTTYYGPTGDGGDPTRGLPKIGSPLGITADGSAIVGSVLGPQLIPGAPPTLILPAGGPGCVPPVITSIPTNPTNFSACSNSILMSSTAAGTMPITYQWYKDGSPLPDGITPGGSTVSGSTNYLLSIAPPLTGADTGTYFMQATGACGTPANSASTLVQFDPAFPPVPNDTCATAEAVAAGTNVLAPAQSPCGAYVNDPVSGASCATSGSKADRWFVFTPTTTGDYRIETCGANYDTVVSLFDECGGSELACNNDYTTGPTTGCTSSRSRIPSYTMTAGETYFIRIAAPMSAFLSTTSTMNLSITTAPAAAPNDACTNPSMAVLGANAFDTTEATPDFFTVTCSSGSVNSRDVWFEYSPPANGYLDAATCPGTSINTVLSIHDGPCGAELACNDNANVAGCTNQSKITHFRVDFGHSYTLRVAGNGSSVVGAGILTLTMDCDADIDNNGVVDLSDLTQLLANFGCTSSCTVDLNGDGITDLVDLTLLLSAFGQSCL